MKNLVILATGAALGVAAVLTVACAAPDGTVTEHPPVVETAPATPAPVTHPRPADGDRATGPVDAYDTGVLFCGALADVAVDVDPHGNAWAYCDPR